MANFHHCMAALRLLSARRTVSMDVLKEAMGGASKRTVLRTIQDLRDFFHLDIEGLKNGGYRMTRKLGPVPAHDPVDRSFIGPGMMLSANEAYDLVRLLNATGAIDPGLLYADSIALRGLLKQMLAGMNFEFQKTNRKLRFELPHARSTEERTSLLALSCALKENRQVMVRFRRQPELDAFSPQYLAMTPTGWEVQLFQYETGAARREPVAELVEVHLLSEPAVRQPGVDDDYERQEQAVLNGDA